MARDTTWDHWVPPDRTKRPKLELIFGPKPFTPLTTCDDIHPRGPIPKGSACCCASCSKSGKDHLKLAGEPIGSRLDPDYKYEPPPQPTKYEPPAKGAEPTRKQKRAALFNRITEGA